MASCGGAASCGRNRTVFQAPGIQTQRTRSAAVALPPLLPCIYFYLSGTKDKKEEVRPIGTQVKPCSKALEHFWNRMEHWNSVEGLALGDRPQGGGVE